MPQKFQVLKCFKCSIFQVHQTRKDNKWQCKVCDEKQSVKRHYGVGTAKDCRLHVQKLNNIQGDIQESQLRATSDYEDYTENAHENKNKLVLTDNARKESRWFAFVEKEETTETCSFVEQDSVFIKDNKVNLEVPKKRKVSPKKTQFKIPKVSKNKDFSENNDSEKVLPLLNCVAFDNYNHIDSPISVVNQMDSEKNRINNNHSKKLRTNRASKWAQYLSGENTEIDNYCGVVDNDYNNREGNITYNKADPVEYNYCKQKSEVCNDDQRQVLHSVTNKDVHNKTITIKPIFSLSDENNLDDILNF